jgi:NADH-quinone oxidoreductase subunit J
MVELLTFVIAAVIVLGGGLGVIVARNPVHAALSLVASLFGIAVLFVAQEAHFLAAVQVIVYTGAIVVLILFVLMLLGVDKEEDTSVEPITGQRPLAVLLGALGLVAIAAVLLVPVIAADDAEPQVSVDTVTGEETETPAEDPSFENRVLTGQQSVTGAIREPAAEGEDGEVAEAVATDTDIRQIGTVLFTDYVFAFEVTALLLTIAVVGAVMMARRVRDPQPLPPDPEPIDPAHDEDAPEPEVADA